MKKDMAKIVEDIIYNYISPEDWTQDELERLAVLISDGICKRFIVFETAEDRRIQKLEADLWHRILTDYHYLLTANQRENKLWKKLTEWREEYLKNLENI